MAERNMLFTWQPESFNEVQHQSDDLLGLRIEFTMRGFPLSRSLLIWEKDNNWSLVDFENEKAYHIEVDSDEVEISEETGSWDLRETSLANLLTLSTVDGTQEGIIDWLLTLVKHNVVTFDQSNLDDLKRTDLSARRLSFEIVHPDLLTAYSTLQEILTAPRESLIGLSKDNLQQVKNYLQQLLDRFREIHNFNPQSSSETHNLREEHKATLQEIIRFCDEVKQQLGPTVAYLQSKEVEQLETQVKATINDAIKDAVEELKTEKDLSQKQSNQVEQNEAKREETFNQLKSQLEDLLAEESVSKYEKIFEEQAKEHHQAALWWLGLTGGLIVGFGIVFYWLFNSLKLGGTEWVGILQNIFTKGFLLSLIYLVLNRSIKNFTAEKHLEVVNRHRRNALQTFNAFVSAAGENQETRDAVLLAATNAIFDANQSGYLSTKSKGPESTGAVQHFVRAVIPGSSTTKSE